MILGIDTSNYTTSVAVTDKNKSILFDERIMLKVKQGDRGLRQSEAFYQHVNQLPSLFNKVKDFNLSGVSVSAAPRRIAGSYMPCFKAGEAFAKVISDMLKLPLMKTTHQEGHIEAAVLGNDSIDLENFLCVHLSGGTTEILNCSKDKTGYTSNIIGKTIDISAGQFIDRVGVRSGFSFPCGKEMDRLYDAQKAIHFPVSVQGADMSFSGVESQSMRYQEAGYDDIAIISGVFECVGETVKKAVLNAAKNQPTDIVFAGGVSGSKHIRNILSTIEEKGHRVFFARENLGSDNAVGVSLIGHRTLKGTEYGK